LQKAHNGLEQRVEERTAELRKANKELAREIEEHRQSAESLRKALSVVKKLKDQLEVENIYFRREMKLKHQFNQILGQSDSLRHVLFRAEQVAPQNTTVLILGETGTGKELIAAAIHNMSPRKDRALITVNCAALPANLIENELFGREKGPLPEPIRGRQGGSRLPMGPPFAWTRLENCRWNSRPSCSG
jgi:formate hydrogenlyase transcriptional activator